MNEDGVRILAPQVLGILVRRGNDFAAAEDVVQDAERDYLTKQAARMRHR